MIDTNKTCLEELYTECNVTYALASQAVKYFGDINDRLLLNEALEYKNNFLNNDAARSNFECHYLTNTFYTNLVNVLQLSER